MSFEIAHSQASDEGGGSVIPLATREEIGAESGIGREVNSSRHSRSVTDLSKDGETPDTTSTFSSVAGTATTTVTVTAEERSSFSAHDTGTSRGSPGLDNVRIHRRLTQNR